MSALDLKVKTEPRPSSRLAVKVEIPAERCKASYEEAISRLSSSIKLPGFRKGKVPKAVLIQQIGQVRIRATALENLIDGVWREVLEQDSIKPLCEPNLDGGFEELLEAFEPNKDLSLTLETDIAPKPKLKSSKGLKAEAEAVSFNPEQIDELIEQSRKQLATLVPVENRKAASGDLAVVNFKGTFKDDGSEIEGGSSESMDVELEKGQMIPGFIEGVIGMAVNEEKTVTCKFPDDYSSEVARGREANFLIKIKEIKTRELPALDDAFAKQASDKSNMAELRQELEERLKKDASQRHQNNRDQALLKALVEQLEVDLPETLIQQEVRNLIEQTASNLSQQGVDVKSMFTAELVKSLMESSREEAKDNLRRNLALQALAETEDLAISQDAIETKCLEVKQELANVENIDTEKLKEVVSNDLLQEKLLEWLEENNTIIDKPSPKESEKPVKSTQKEKRPKQAKEEKSSKQKPKN